MNVLERKKLKSRNPGVPESRSFLVRYRRTYVLNNCKHIFLVPTNLLKMKCSNTVVYVYLRKLPRNLDQFSNTAKVLSNIRVFFKYLDIKSYFTRCILWLQQKMEELWFILNPLGIYSYNEKRLKKF